MKYIVSEEELDYILENIDTDEGRYYAIKKIKDIKSKQPVECIAEGVVDVFKYNTLVGKLSMGPEKCEFVEKINAYSGKSIEIYIKEVK